MRKKHSSCAIRSMYRRFGILYGNRQKGLICLICLICNREIDSISHFSFRHRDYYYRAVEAIEKGRCNLDLEIA